MYGQKPCFSAIDSFSGNSSNPVLTMSRPCPVCGGFHDQTILLLDDFQFFSDSADTPKRARLRVAQCNTCHTVYLNPCYSTAGFLCLFEEAGMSYGSSLGRQLEQIAWIEARGLLADDRVLLDVGCYDGAFLGLLPPQIMKMGVDIDAAAVARGNERLGKEGITIINGAFESFQCSRTPDIITMFHVLEHLSNPYEVLVNLRTLSSGQTRLIVEVPVLEHGHTNDINGFFSAQHMTHFSTMSLEMLFVRAGWEILERVQMSDYNGHRVLAKPGIPAAQSINGSSEDRKLVYGYLAQWYANLEMIAARIEPLSPVSRMVIWGGGMHTEFLYQKTPLFFQNSERSYLIVDSDSLKQGRSWRGVGIVSPEVLSQMEWDGTVLLISSYGGQDAIYAAALEAGIPETSIVKLYDSVMVY